MLLVIPFRRLRPLVIIVTSFTVGHSISLIAAAFGFVPDALWFPPLIETLIAVTIIYMALENIIYAALGTFGGDISRRWIIAFAFGLVHGFSFSFTLRESLQFSGTENLAYKRCCCKTAQHAAPGRHIVVCGRAGSADQAIC